MEKGALFCLDYSLVENKLNNFNVNVNKKMKCSNYYFRFAGCRFQINMGSKKAIEFLFLYDKSRSILCKSCITFHKSE